MKKIVCTFVVVSIFVLGGVANADLIASWDNDDINGAATAAADSSHAQVTPTDISLGAGLAVTAWNNSLATFSHDLSTSLAGAISANDYFTFSASADAGQQIDYSSLFTRVNLNRGGTTLGMTINFTLMASTVGFTDGDEVGSFTASHPAASGITMTTHTYDLTGVTALQDVVGSHEFRLYAYRTDGEGNRMAIGQSFATNGDDDLRLDGTVEAVPEPGSLALFVLSGIGLFIARKLRTS